jgi:hypothetical protein
MFYFRHEYHSSMAQGPITIFDKSTLQCLTDDEAVLLDNFYMSNITPVFIAECLADLDRDMESAKSKGSPESMVGSLARKTPDSQACGNVFHMQILKGELAGEFDLSTVHFRPLRGRGERVVTGNSKGVVFRQSEEEEAIHRWSRREFWELEHDIAKQWRQAIERIDLNASYANILNATGTRRKPTSLEEAKLVTDSILDSIDQEWLLRFGLHILDVPEATEWVMHRWKADGRPLLRSYLPYFIHMLSINVFFALALSAKLLKNVKPSHAIDLAYLYYLPFCTVFTSRDKFHVQVVPLFMDPFQTFVHGDDLKADLKRLDERYKQLPEDELNKGLIGFAAHPPEDTSFLTTRLWDQYLPKWRDPQTPMGDLPKEVLQAIDQMAKKVSAASPSDAHDAQSISELDFMTITKTVSTKKGSYLRFAKDTILRINEEERRKAEEKERERVQVHSAGTAFASLSNQLAEIVGDPKNSHVELYLQRIKLDQSGGRIVEEGMWLAEILPIGLSDFDQRAQTALKREFDRAPIVAVLALWTRYGAGKLGILRVRLMKEGDDPRSVDERDYDDWEHKVIPEYMNRHKL